MNSNALTLPTTPVARAASRVSNAPSDGKADPVIYNIIGYGTTEVERLNSNDATVSLLPSSRSAHYEAQKRLWKFAGIAAVVLGTVSLVGVAKGGDAWRAHRARVESEARDEAARKQADELRASQLAIAEKLHASEKAEQDARKAAPEIFAAFVAGVDQAPDSFSTAKHARENPPVAAGVAETVRLIAAGQPADNTTPLLVAGPWPSPVVYRALPNGDFLFGFSIDDQGYQDDQKAVRKALVVYKSASEALTYQVGTPGAGLATREKMFTELPGFTAVQSYAGKPATPAIPQLTAKSFFDLMPRIAKGFVPAAPATQTK